MLWGLLDGWAEISQQRPYAPHLQKVLSERRQDVDIEVLRLGFPGWKSTDLLKDADGSTGLRTVLRGNQKQGSPISLVILLAGTNDLSSNKSSAEIL